MIYKLLLFIGIILNVIAQTLLKISVKDYNFFENKFDLFKKLLHLLLNPYFILSIIIYTISFVIYSIALSKLELSKAYPVSSTVAIILIFFISIIFFSESFNLNKILGLIFCIIGIFLVFFK